MKIKVILGDITTLNCDAIVNAANPSLLGGGVDGAIHRNAGLELLEECRLIRKDKYPNGLPTGQAVITKGYKLSSKYVIHTVGTIYGMDDTNLLKDCYLNSLKLAEANNCKTIAFPAISTGVYGLPIYMSAKIVNETLSKFQSTVIDEINLVLFSKQDYDVYSTEIKT
jgi:O-acetyl-ADP-ribose deacetylase (regulator of RNase III)